MEHSIRRHLNTAHGRVPLPAYVPVTTFGDKYPLDDLIRPYLPRLAYAAMVSFYYARQMKERPSIPLFIDSGGYASLFSGVEVRSARGLGLLHWVDGNSFEVLHPRDVFELQEQHADVAFTLDFPIPPSMSRREANRRVSLTVANAQWALANRRRRDLLLYACVQGLDLKQYKECASEYVDLDFDGIAIGGLVPRASELSQVFKIIDSVREVLPDKPIHAFGLGKPDVVSAIYQRGVDSTDSSSYVQLAARGRQWGSPDVQLHDASAIERMHLALCNLAMATQRTLPLSASPLVFDSPILGMRSPQDRDHT